MVNGVGGPGGAGKFGGVPAPGVAGAPGVPQPSSAERKGFGEAIGAPERPERAVEATATPPLERLRAGEIDLPQYVELRVREATAHLEGVVAPADLEEIRAALHDTLESDPDVAALAQAARIGS